LTNRRDDNPADRMTRDDLFEAYFNRELSSQLQMELDSLLERDAAAAQIFSEMKLASEALRAPIDAPDNTLAILAEVGHRRGWLGARLQRFVSVGRLAIAATFLLTITAALAAKRFAPDAAIFPAQATPLANVADSAADDTNCGVSDFMEAVNSLGASSKLTRVSKSMPTPMLKNGPVTLNASFISLDPHSPPACTDASKRFAYTVRVMSLRDGSFRKLADQQRIGSAVIVVGSSPEQADKKKDEKDSSVTGW
jgi:hypothetical protein